MKGLPEMRTVSEQSPISLDDLRKLAAGRFGDMIKGVVDLNRAIMALDADMHADEEAALLAEGSCQLDLWGISLYPDLPDSDWLELDCMINLRPSSGNLSKGVDDPAIRERIAALIDRLVLR